MYESNYIPGMNQCKNLRMQLCPHWITHPSWQELIALKWIVYSPLASGIKINARRVNSVSSPERTPAPPLPFQPTHLETLYKIRSKERKKRECRRIEKHVPFPLSASALPAGKRPELFIRLHAAVYMHSTHSKVTPLKHQSSPSLQIDRTCGPNLFTYNSDGCG